MRHLCLTILTITLFTPFQTSHALAFQIMSPIIGFPEDADPEKVKQILKLLANEGEFIDGYAGGLLPNGYQNIDYAASMDTLSQLLKLLEEGCQLNVLVKFAELDNEKTTFQTNQYGTDLRITINLNNKSNDLTQLTIPTINTVPMPDPFERQESKYPKMNYHTIKLPATKKSK